MKSNDKWAEMIVTSMLDNWEYKDVQEVACFVKAIRDEIQKEYIEAIENVNKGPNIRDWAKSE